MALDKILCVGRNLETDFDFEKLEQATLTLQGIKKVIGRMPEPDMVRYKFATLCYQYCKYYDIDHETMKHNVTRYKR